MADLRGVLSPHVESGSLPGAVALVARGDRIDVRAVGSVDVEGTAPMATDSIFRIASLSKPITAAAVMMLVDDGRIALDDPIARWLPELAAPAVVRTPTGPLDDVVPAARPITVFDLLTFRAGYGFPSDFSVPAARPLLELAAKYVPHPPAAPPLDEWLADLAGIPMISQPGETWLYHVCSDLQGALVARVTGSGFSEFLAERVLGPLGMVDTGFHVPAEKVDRFAVGHYWSGRDGGLNRYDDLADWTTPPVFPSGAGGLVSTADDLYRFGRLLLAGGVANGRRLLSAESVRRMTTDHLTEAQRDASTLFLEGQGWGFGGSVDVAATDPWSVPGRYGWVGGFGTAAHIVPSTDTVTVLLTQRDMAGPTPTDVMRDFWRHAADAA